MATDSVSTQSPQRRHGAAAALESISSLVSLVAIAGLFVNWLNAYLTFFGEAVEVDPSQVRSYWALLGLLAAGLVGSYAGAAWRRARGAYVWHALVALAGVAAAVLFAVTSTGAARDEPDPVRPPPSGSQCHSGGDSSECLGG